MVRLVLGLDEIDHTQVAVVGGKGAQLGELTRIDGVRVPAGFCVTTEAFRRSVADAASVEGLLDRLSRVTPEDRESIRDVSAEIRRALEAVALPEEVVSAVKRALEGLDGQAGYAVRSSATSEDAPHASFAGQHDTYLNVVGTESVLRHVSRCWASLFTERVVTYRLRQGFDHRRVGMAVVVQRMVPARAAGTLFTADPVTSNRRLAYVEATFGLGEALVSGLVRPDVYQVRDGGVVATTVGTKSRAQRAGPEGGTEQVAVDPERQRQPVLAEAEVVRLERLGRLIEAHFGRPQDIEWCLGDDGFEIVQSRPITTLFPIPVSGDAGNHVYVSVGHQQMMTDAMKPLGISLWQLTSRAPMRHAGGRLFVDVTQHLASPTSRAAYLQALGSSDPLIGDALQAIVDRPGFLPTPADQGSGGLPSWAAPAPSDLDPAIVGELIGEREASVATLQRDIRSRSGAALLDFILADIGELRRILSDPPSQQAITAAMQASAWLNEHLGEWLGEQDAVDVLTQSVPHNVTAEMGLALLDVADVIRPYPEVVALLEQAADDTFLDDLTSLEGGREARDALRGYLDSYGMRCVGEIDITRPRWSERPSSLLPMLLSNVRNFEPDAARRLFEQGRQAAGDKERELLVRLRALPDGERRAGEVKRMIGRLRSFMGYREYPKYHMVSRYLAYKQALLGEGERLARAGLLDETEDIFYLTFQELDQAVRTRQVDSRIIARRKDEFMSYQSLTPPRVLTSDGEIVTGTYRRHDVPAGALVGLAVSAGTVEGRARVVASFTDAELAPGDILVTAYTDPSWTPAFVTIRGLVTEVGGLMTHGAVIAREYGVPMVVGVEHATRLIRDGQRIRVHGADGYVELVP